MRKRPTLAALIRGALIISLTGLVIAVLAVAAEAQRRPRATQPEAPPPVTGSKRAAAADQPSAIPDKERLEADVSSRSIPVTSTFSGTRVVVFGSVVNSRQASAEAGYYDVVVVIEGGQSDVVARMKSRVGGIWLNTESLTFSGVPNYYAIVSTRPLEDIADPPVLDGNGIGFEHVRMTPASEAVPRGSSDVGLETFRGAVTRLKKTKGLFVEDQYGVSFIGRSLLRASVDLPPNIPIGELTTRMHLFRDGELLDTFRSRLILQREGVGSALHAFAFDWSLLYGIATVLTAVAAGLGASMVFSRSGH